MSDHNHVFNRLFEVTEGRTWALPGDLCRPRFGSGIVPSIVQNEGGRWGWGPLRDLPAISDDEPAIIITLMDVWWSGVGNTRSLVYVVGPNAIGWDDRGNYGVVEHAQ